MSAGHVDQEYVDSAKRAVAHATKVGKRAVNTAIHHNPDGSRTFVWRFDPIEKVRPAKSDSQKSTVGRSDNNRPARVSRGVRTRPPQGDLDLD
jgi:hypothetical protein